MVSLLLALIYLAFISLGLPDSLLGSAWPVMQSEMNLPLSYAGIITMIIAACTIVSSLLADRLHRKLGTHLVTSVSVLLTALSMIGFSLSHHFFLLCLLAIPYGLGAGSIDTALNNYVALYFSSRHMSWLHCFWGVGCAISPYIMSYALTSGAGWHTGYQNVGFIQLLIAAILFCSFPLWKRMDTAAEEQASKLPVLSLGQVLGIRGIKYILVAFFAYCALESTAGLWASSYLVMARGIESDVAAKYASLFYLGISGGRFLSGFFADAWGDKKLVRIGLATLTVGIIAVWFSFLPDFVALLGLVVIGFGCAPVFPSIIHATPVNFGRENSQAAIGVQMASAYTGTTLMPPLFGLIANHVSISLYPIFLFMMSILMVAMTESLNRIMSKAHRAEQEG